MRRWKRDIILSVCILIFVIVTSIYSILLDSPRIKLFWARPDTYMALWLVILAILAILLLIRALRERNAEEEIVLPKIWDKLSIFTAVLLIVYLLTIKYLGFLVGSFILLWLLVSVYSYNFGNGEKAKGKELVMLIIKSGVFSIIVSYAVTLLFTKLLSSKLPVFSLF